MVKHVDSGGQVHLVTNIRKPRKWRRYEYLLSSGTLWIDTGISLSLTDKFEFETDFTYSESSRTPYPFYGTASYNTGFMAQYHYISNLLYPLYILGANIGEGSISITAGSRMYSKTIIDVPNKTWAWTYNNTSSSGTYSNQITDTTSTVNIYRSAAYSPYPAKCYYFKIKRNDVLIRHFVPAQYNGQYGMWDLVEDKFYRNAGTGAFTVGPEMKNYDEIYEVRKTSSLLPAGVELYDYILSSSTLYINILASNSKDKLEIKLLSTGGGYMFHNGTTLLGVNDSRYGLTTTNTIYTLVATKTNNVWTWSNLNNNTSYTNNFTGYDHSEPDGLFAFYGGSLPTAARIYYYKAWNNNVLICNLLPCTYLGEPGMWDTVENKFYRNQGTGLFTLGNKITLKEYEYLLNDTNSWINTGVTPTSDTNFDFEMSWNGTTKQDVFFGCSTLSGYNDGYNFSIDKSEGGRIIYTCTQGYQYSSIYINVDTKYRFVLNNNVISINGIHYNVTKSSIPNLSIYLFSRNLNNIANPSSDTYTNKEVKKLYYCKLYNGFILIRDFIPVSYNGTPGLWDKVEWKFYANAGSGSFTLGPEKKSGSIYLHSHLTNLFDGFVAGGLMTLSNGVLTSTGANSDTYFFTKTTQAVNTTSYYLVGVYVEGYDSATTWTFCSPQSNSNATLRITRDGWNWGYVKFGGAGSLLIWDDANRAFSGPIPKITISDCRIYKIT